MSEQENDAAYEQAHADDLAADAAEAAAEAAGPDPSYVAYWDQRMASSREARPERYAETDIADWDREMEAGS